MKEHKTLKIDMAFKGLADKELIESLNNGWSILDKTVERERYLYYVLVKEPPVKYSTP